MNKLLKILLASFLLPLLFLGCNGHREPKNYIESKPSFFDIRNENLLTNDWLRKPENLLMLHETFKAFEYWNFLNFYSDRFNSDFIVERDIYIKKNPLQLIDSLILTYEDKTIDVKYYNEFWARRRAEHNDSIVYAIARSIKDAKPKTYQHRITHCKFKGFANDTLFDLLSIEIQQRNLNDSLALEHFETLRNYGFHQSAYNLLHERGEYYDIKWNTDALEKTLTEQVEYSGSWFEDNTK